LIIIIHYNLSIVHYPLNKMSSIKKVLIVGGGIGGLSLGIALRRAGMDAEIVEINKEFNVYGVGIIQLGNAIRALDAIGVAEETIKRGCPYGMVKMCAPNGFQFTETGTPPMTRFNIIHNGISRRILHDVLLEAAVENGVTIRMGVTISEIENEGTRVGVKFTDNTEGSYQLVVGADGIYSKVRSLIFGNYEANYIKSSVWRYPFKRPAELDTAYMYFGKKTKVGLIPMTADMMYMFIVAAEGDDNPVIPQEEFVPRMQAHLAEYPVKMVADRIAEITDSTKAVYSPLKTLMMPAPWYKNRVVMIGDAAHATIPQLGSGAALAIEDGVVLAEELQKDQNIEDALENYMTRRHERCKMVIDVSNTLAEWEQMEWKGIPLPEGANIGALMGKTLASLAAPI
jgi:2-polyprenyl-6-methoxyphenol hydroxylase-like FAD-dependent oxidoreductase